MYSSGYGGEVGAVETRWDLEELWELERQFVRSCAMRKTDGERGKYSDANRRIVRPRRRDGNWDA